MSLHPGTRLGPYEIVAPLGAGGMGEVYRARDPRLGREVAIKVLPAEFAADADRMRRFDQEARAAGSLSHPNIVTVFDVGTDGGTAYVVEELVPGGTLRERLEQGALPLRDVLRIGAGIASGLAAAHEKGIVHRDLKPENVALASDGRPQLLDFGLARVVAPVSEATLSAQPTSAGAILGTVGYMAPEQARGEAADARSDLFALGTMLHEMLSGVRPFSRGSAVETLHAILKEEPPPLPAEVPAGLARVVERCLEKDPRARFQSARDLAFALGQVSGDSGRVSPAVIAEAQASRRRGLAPVAWLVGAALLAAIAFFAGRGTAPQAPVGAIRISTLSQGTRDTEPSVSPDGRLVAFSAVRQNGQGIWIMDMVSRSEVRLTDRNDHLPRFTNDGGSIVFSRYAGQQQSIWRVPAIGGTPRMLVEHGSDADCSPDGSQIAYIGSSTDSTSENVLIVVAKSDGSGAREVWAKPNVIAASPRWSPDGRHVAFVVAGNQNNPNAIGVVEVATGRTRIFPSPHAAVLSSPAWDGDGGMIVAEGEGIVALQRGASARLFRLDPRSGHWRALGWITDYPVIMDLAPDGRIVMSALVARQNLVEAPVGARDLAESRTLTSGLVIDRQPVFSPDGKSVMFSSNRGGTLDLWEVSLEGGELHRLTDDPADDWDPAYSPDGQSIFWSSNRGGGFEIWTARRDGSAPRQVSHDSLDAENPAPTRDGRGVLYSSSNPEKAGLWSIPLEGGTGDHLLRSSTLIPDLSPDGRYVSVVRSAGTLLPNLTVFDLEQRRELPAPVGIRLVLGAFQAGRSRWSPDGGSLVYTDNAPNGQTVLLRRPLADWRGEGSRVDTLYPRTPVTIESFGFSPDGKRAVLSVVDWLTGLTITDAIPGIRPPKRN